MPQSIWLESNISNEGKKKESKHDGKCFYLGTLSRHHSEKCVTMYSLLPVSSAKTAQLMRFSQMCGFEDNSYCEQNWSAAWSCMVVFEQDPQIFFCCVCVPKLRNSTKEKEGWEGGETRK